MFFKREVVLDPGTAHVYEPCDWRDALVLVKAGSIELETGSGVRRIFVAGDVLWLARLPLRLLRNPGPKPAVLEASRRDPWHLVPKSTCLATDLEAVPRGPRNDSVPC